MRQQVLKKDKKILEYVGKRQVESSPLFLLFFRGSDGLPSKIPLRSPKKILSVRGATTVKRVSSSPKIPGTFFDSLVALEERTSFLLPLEIEGKRKLDTKSGPPNRGHSSGEDGHVTLRWRGSTEADQFVLAWVCLDSWGSFPQRGKKSNKNPPVLNWIPLVTYSRPSTSTHIMCSR